MVRIALLDSSWCGYVKRGLVRALCDLALRGMDSRDVATIQRVELERRLTAAQTELAALRKPIAMEDVNCLIAWLAVIHGDKIIYQAGNVNVSGRDAASLLESLARQVWGAQEQIAFLERFADPPDMTTGETVRDELRQRIKAAERRAQENERDAERWREHCKVLHEATLKNALHVDLRMRRDGQAYRIEFVVSIIELDTAVAKVLALRTEAKYLELRAAMNDAALKSSGKANG